MKTCPECRTVYPDSANYCTECQTPLVDVAQVRLQKPGTEQQSPAPEYNAPQYSTPSYDDYYRSDNNLPQRTEPAKPVGSSGLSIAGFIVSLVGLFISFWGITCIVGLVLSCCGRSKDRASGASTGMATAGVVLGIIGIILSVLTVIACGTIIGSIR